MSSLRRVRTVQAHYVPDVAYMADGPNFDLPQEVGKIPDPGPDEFPPGATVLNGMQGVELFRCEVCNALVAESEFDGHLC